MSDPIKASLERLIDILQRLMEHVEEMTGLELKKNRALNAYDLEAINEVMDDEEEQEAYYDELERERTDEIERLADSLGFDAGLSMEKMIEYFPAEYRDDFRKLRAELIRKKESLEVILQENMALIEDNFD